jgi:DNA-binding transcriptional LysR family regulator
MIAMTELSGIPASHHISVSQLTIFATVAACSSFSSAAQHLSTSQSSLSRKIRDMEQALGATLFERAHNGVALSKLGVNFLPAALELLKKHAQAYSGMASWRASQLTKFQVVGSSSVMPLVLPVLLQTLRAEFGSAAMSVIDATSDEVLRKIIGGEANLGVYADFEEKPELRYTPVLDAPLGLLTASDCPLPAHIESLDDLSGVHVVRFGERTLVTQLLRHSATHFPAYFDSPITVERVMGAFDLVRQSGMALVVSGLSATLAQAEGMLFTPLPKLLPTVQVSIVSRRDEPFDARQELMRDILRASIFDTAWHPSVQRFCATANRRLTSL